MKNIKLILLFSSIYLLFGGSLLAQSQNERVGIYINSYGSAMFLDNHIGRAVGFNLGITSKNQKWSVGMRFYNRSGPINEHQEYELVLPEGETYKGKSSLLLGADHGYIGLEAAYNLQLANEKLFIRLPVSFGQIGAGFYLKDEDRVTPDGRRVSEWEDELQGGTDAGFGLAGEVGVEVYYLPFEKLPQIGFGGGVHFTKTFGYTSFLGGDDFYNNKPRISAGLYIKL